jgi:glyoxylase I family protein
MTENPLARPQAIHHVRLTVTDIGRSKEFYRRLLGVDPVIDTSDQTGQPGVSEDPARYYGGCIFPVGDRFDSTRLFGLRPVADAGDRFDSTRVGLDHVSLRVGSRADLVAAAGRLDAAGVEHGEVIDFAESGLSILSLQDPDDINLELVAPPA